MTMRRINRLLRLIQMLQWERRCSVDRLHSELGVTRRTIFRDLKVLEGAGMPCTFDKDSQSYVLDRESLLPPLTMTLEEALALAVLTRKALHSRVFPGHRAALTAALKVESALPPEIRRHCGDQLAQVDVRFWPTSDLETAGDVLVQLQRALTDRRKVTVRYESYYENREIDTVLHPYRLRFIRRGWYVIAFSRRHGQVRTFKIERIVSARTLDEPYVIDPDFDLEDYYGNAWQMIRGDKPYHVVIHFSPLVAGNLEEVVWHRTQQTERRPDGSVIFEVDVDGISEIAWWVLGYGKEAVVKQPPELRALVVEHARAMMAAYAAEDGAGPQEGA